MNLPMVKLRRCSGDDFISTNNIDLSNIELKLYYESFGPVYETKTNTFGNIISSYIGSSIRVFGDFSQNPDWVKEVNKTKWVYKFSVLGGKFESVNLGWIFRGTEKISLYTTEQKILELGIKKWIYQNELQNDYD